MSEIDLHTLIEAAYEAALEPEKWGDLSLRLQEAFQSPVAGLFFQNQKTQECRRANLIGLKEEYALFYGEYYGRTSPWLSLAAYRPDLTFTEESVDRFYNRPGLFYETEYFNDWLKPQGFWHTLGGNIQSNGPYTLNIILHRGLDEGPFTKAEIEKFERLQPHIARAASIASRFEDLQWRVQAYSELLDRLPMGLVLLDGQAQILHVNQKGKEWLGSGDPIKAQGKALRANSLRNDEHLQGVIREALGFREGGPAPSPNLLSLPGSDRNIRLSVAVVPLPRDRSFFTEEAASVAVFFSSPEQALPINHKRLQSCYALTISEARLTAELARRANLKEAARATGVSYETSRGYLKTVLQKTGTRSQVDLLGRLFSDWSLLV